jgi:hypothetical protein
MSSLSVGLQIDLDGTLRRVDAGAQHFSRLAVDPSRAQIADLSGAQSPDAGVADAHPTAVGQGGACVLACLEDRPLTVAGGLDIAGAEADRATPSTLAVADLDVRLKVLDVKLCGIASSSPVLADYLK